MIKRKKIEKIKRKENANERKGHTLSYFMSDNKYGTKPKKDNLFKTCLKLVHNCAKHVHTTKSDRNPKLNTTDN